MSAYAELCAWTLARARRSGDAAAVAGYLGSGDAFDRALAAYADRNEDDYGRLLDAVRTGRVVTETAR